jgi:hypothetical protein
MKKLFGLLLVSVLVVSGNEVFAQGRGRGPKHHGKNEKARVHQGRDEVVHAREVIAIDRDGYRRVIVDYYSAGLPPGLARREELPPGLRKQLRERGALPPGLQKRLVVVPDPLIRRLPPVPAYSTRYFAGSDLIVVDRRRNVILTIVPDVLPLRR